MKISYNVLLRTFVKQPIVCKLFQILICFFSPAIMITTGIVDVEYGTIVSSTELFGNLNSTNFSRYPLSLYGATGSIINNTIIVCGGYTFDGGNTKKCYYKTYFNSSSGQISWIYLTNMRYNRFLASSTVIGSQLWVTGGSLRNFTCLKVIPIFIWFSDNCIKIR